MPLVLLPVWYLIYHYLQPMTDFFIGDTLGMTKGEHLTEAVGFSFLSFQK